MKKKENNPRLIELFIVLVVVVVGGGAGWIAYKNSQSKKTTQEPELTSLCASPNDQINGRYSSDSDAQEDPGEINWDITVFCDGTVLFHDDTVHAIHGEDIEARATIKQVNDLVSHANQVLDEPVRESCVAGHVDGLIEEYYGKTGEYLGVTFNNDSNAWVSCREDNTIPTKSRVEFLKKLSDLVPGFPYHERLEILSKYNS